MKTKTEINKEKKARRDLALLAKYQRQKAELTGKIGSGCSSCGKSFIDGEVVRDCFNRVQGSICERCYEEKTALSTFWGKTPSIKTRLRTFDSNN
jgi:CRISPR/Cas system-associated protein Cas10 (large subunit of type III CRISPR-Cas system)